MEVGSGWTVRRRWSDPSRDGVRARFLRRVGRVRDPLRGRGRRRSSRADAADAGAELASGCLDDEIAIVVLVLGVVVVLFVFLWELFLFAVLAALGELVLLVLLASAGLVGRVLLRHPWTVEAVHRDGRRREWQVRGLRRSERFAAMARQRLDAGWPPDRIDESDLTEE